jgi:uncharacterized membrane protein YeaQ/YmgE (transglycosylase-associated protein family)
MINVLSWIVVGLIAGWLARIVMKGTGYSVIGDMIVGIVGALLAGWTGTTLLHINTNLTGINVVSILIAFVGAVVLLVILRAFSGRRVLN